MRSIESPLLKRYKDILHAFSTRAGGYSKHPFLGNNLAFHVNDSPHTVNKNHLHFAKELGYPYERLIRMEQVHGDAVVIIDKNFDLKQIPKCDAIITDLKNTPLMVMVADCIPVLIYDPVKKVIATVHAGRAGVFSRIVPKTINKIKEKFKSKPENLLIALGPSIFQCCYEVGIEIKKEAEKYAYDYAISTKKGRYYLDLNTIIYRQLQELGIKEKNIELSQYCTSCNNDIFYSYRGENSDCGRFCGLLMLK